MINDIQRSQSILIVVKLFDLNFPQVFSLECRRECRTVSTETTKYKRRIFPHHINYCETETSTEPN